MDGELHQKMIIADFHSAGDATQAEEEFIKVFRTKQVPDEIQEMSLESGLWKLPRLLVSSDLVPSMAEARRLIEQGGVSVDGVKRSDSAFELSLGPDQSVLLQVGKRRFLRLRGQ